MARQRRGFELTDPGVPKPKASHYRYLKAVVDVLDSGKQLNAKTIADELAISRTAVWAMRKRHPWLEPWVNTIVGELNDNIVQLVIRKMGNVALKGSVPHAELFLKSKGQLKVDGPGGGPLVAFQVNVNGIPAATSMEQWPGGVLEAPKA